MTGYAIFVLAFLAGACIGLRDLPIAALMLGGALLAFALMQGGLVP